MIEIKNIVSPNILQLKPYSSARDEFSGREGIFLDANENPFGELNRYPDPYQKKLKQKLSLLKTIDYKNIFIGNGSDEIIDLAFRIFCRYGKDKALTFSPTYGMYEVSAAINNIELVKVPLNRTFQIDLKKVKPILNDRNLKLIFICSPNNPTGNLISQESIEYILNRFKGIVILDEAYIDFAEKGSLIKLINQYNNLIVIQTFSKAWGLAGARVGTGYANEEIIALFNKIKPPYNVSEINQQTVIEALDNYDVYKERLASIIEERERLKIEFQKLDLIKKVYPSDANFLLLQVNNSNLLYSQLLKKQIITRNRNSQLANCLRITIGTKKENNELLNALKKLQ